MPSLVSAFIIAIMLGVLAVMPKVDFGDVMRAWLLGDSAFWVVSVVLVAVCAGLPLTTKIPAVWAKRLCQSLLLTAGVALFAMRAMMAYLDFQTATIDKPYTVTATAHIDEISDGVYDELSGTSFRQKATIDELQLINHLNANGTTTLHNPFAPADVPDVPDTSEQGANPQLPKRMTVLLTAQPNHAKNIKNIHHIDKLTPNTSVRLTLLLEPIRQDKSATGFDSDVWLRTRHIHATARILAIDNITTHDAGRSVDGYLQSLRQRLRQHFYDDWHTMDIDTQQAHAVTLSLLTGDRALISRATKDLYQLAGISHLLAISGTHVVFLAVMLAGFVTALIDRLCPFCYQRVARWQIRLVLMVMASVLYAMFTGFDVPAVRTVYMLAMMALARYLVLPVSNLTVLFVVGLVMAWLDPYVLWQAGFWLSFVAVFLLMRYEVAAVQGVSHRGGFWHNAVLMVRLQVWLFVAMLPLSLLFFGKVSLWGVLVNLFAVGLFGVLIVPINLAAGVLFAISPSVSDVLWGVSSAILAYLHDGFSLLLVGDSWLYSSFGAVGFLLFGLALLPLMSRFLAKPLMALPITALALMAIQPVQTPSQATTNIARLPTDNKALQAVLIKQGSQAWLVLADFGMKSLSVGQVDVLIDTLRQHGIRSLVGVVVQTPSTHLPLAVAHIHERLPILHYWQAGRSDVKPTSLAMQSCQVGQSYQADGVSVNAVTGWTQIDDATVWGCTIEVRSDAPMHIIGYQADSDTRSDESDTSTQDIHRLLINGAVHDNTWQLWRWICPADDTDGTQGGLWLSHAYAKDDDEIRHRFGVVVWQND